MNELCTQCLFIIIVQYVVWPGKPRTNAAVCSTKSTISEDLFHGYRCNGSYHFHFSLCFRHIGNQGGQNFVPRMLVLVFKLNRQLFLHHFGNSSFHVWEILGLDPVFNMLFAKVTHHDSELSVAFS